MELAKIRNKARENEAKQVSGDSSEPSVGRLAVTSEPPALALPDELFEGTSQEVAFPGPAPVSIPRLPLRFDPLAVILAGREADLTASAHSMNARQDSEPASREEACEEFLCFTLGGEEYGVNIMEIKEIIKPRELTEVPRAPQFVDGIISLRGLIVPVLDMRKRLALPTSTLSGQQRIVIVRNGGSFTGLRVDAVTGVVRILNSRREATPAILEGVDRDFVAGIGRTDDRMVILLDVRNVADVALTGGGY
jgi:purine-binding chemotaxis protein CheW